MNQKFVFAFFLGMSIGICSIAVYEVQRQTQDIAKTIAPYTEIRPTNEETLPSDNDKEPDHLVPATEMISATQTIVTSVTSTPAIITDKKPPQFVTLAFDGSYSLSFWKESRDFARKMKEQQKPLHFTYFISGVYFVPVKDRMSYLPPQHATGSSAIGWAQSEKEVKARIEQLDLATSEGHEIGSHANGHFDGSKWSLDEWNSELEQFKQMSPKRVYSGFRAPELGRNPFLYEALKLQGFRYDTSDVGKSTEWPKKLPNGLWEFPLNKIRFSTSTQSILSMDYNFYLKQTKAKDILVKGTVEWDRAYQEVLESMRLNFTTNYQGNRAPVTFGNHFSLWNDGLYWEAMKTFAQEVCGLPEVKCVTFSELADYLDQQN